MSENPQADNRTDKREAPSIEGGPYVLSVREGALLEAIMGEVKQVITDQIHNLTEEAAKARREADTLERVETVVAQDTARDDKTTLGESLKRLADAGDRDAAAILAEIDSPEQREFWRFFDEAVALDPYWQKTGDGRFACKRGALHDTPEKLVAAYRTRNSASRSTKT